ncbi:CFI-box-CTERM domain-containing protein [Bdellovibrio bacteriovorus]|uniref:CFI-box-CTERM domain-containing protein n=2 Tax=Bdellovibrio bacteriovorus TaxID=959 RepID=UPI001D054EE2|nr:CFI-box-CTERM domain-containing protein [Bdellovibrio bacteriovorus]
MRLPWTGFQHHLRTYALSTLVGGMLLSAPALATITLVSVDGASRIDLATTETKTTLYAGFAGTCTADANSAATCDSCSGETVSSSKLWPCNKKNAYNNLRITIRVQSSNTSAVLADAIIKVGEDTLTPSINPTLADGILNVQVTWGELCQKLGQSSGCTADFSGELSVGFKTTTDSTTTNDLMTFKVMGRVAKTDGSDWVYTNCPTDDITIPAGSGYCYFSAYRGDEKIYADQLARADDYPASTAPGIEYAGPVFFYEKQLDGEDDNTTIARISNASSYIQLVDPERDNRIDGLENDVRYCMVMANQDKTGIVSYYSPLPGTSGGVDAISLCATPSKVVGLLDDKSCFIATAAFGSDMAPEVQSFRDFRNKYLLSNSVGTRIVKLYYKHSPFYANLIAENEFAKSAVRTILWPLLFFARMSVTFGLWVTLLLAVLTGVSTYEMYRRFVVGRKTRGEA